MKKLKAALTLVLFLSAGAAVVAQDAPAVPAPPPVPAKPVTHTAAQQDPGDRAFQANCSRCHSAPEQLSPHISGTVAMHMRVRANLSAKDQELILKYLAP